MSTEQLPIQEQHQRLVRYLEVLAANTTLRSWRRIGTAVASQHQIQTRIRAPRRGKYIHIQAALTVRGVVVAAAWSVSREHPPKSVKIVATVTRACTRRSNEATGYLDLGSALSNTTDQSAPGLVNAMYDAASVMLRDYGSWQTRYGDPHGP